MLSVQEIMNAAAATMAGDIDVVVVGGTEGWTV